MPNATKWGINIFSEIKKAVYDSETVNITTIVIEQHFKG